MDDSWRFAYTPNSMMNTTSSVTPASASTSSHTGIAARDLFTVEQAAAYLHMSSSSIRAYVRQGNLKAFRVAGMRKVLIAREDLVSLLRPTSN